MEAHHLQAAAWRLPASLGLCRLRRRGGPPRAPEGRTAKPAERATRAPSYGMPMVVCLWYAQRLRLAEAERRPPVSSCASRAATTHGVSSSESRLPPRKL